METWMKAVLWTLLALGILALGVYCYALVQKNKADNARWKRIADQKYREGRSEASQILREAVDQITDDKLRLSGMTDRELLMEAVLGLGGVGRRMDRLEDSVRSFSQLDSVLESVREQTDLISENTALLVRQVNTVQTEVNGFQTSVAGTAESVQSLSASAADAGRLLEEVSSQMQQLNAMSENLSGLREELADMLRRANQTMKATADNPAAVLGQMDGRISAIYGQLENLADGLNLMAESLEGIQETLSPEKTAV